MKKRTFGTRKCVWCGKEFIAYSPTQTACKDDHYRPCAICGQPLKVKESFINYQKYGPRTCSMCKGKRIANTRTNMSDEEKQRIKDKTIATTRDRYGCDFVMQSDTIKERSKKGIRDKYGVDNLSQSSEIQNRIKANSLKKYGTQHPSQNKEIKAKMVKGMLDKYGYEYPLQVPEIREQLVKTNLTKYGVRNVFQADDVKKKIQKTCLEKYGVTHAGSAEEVIAKRTATNWEKYGGPGYVYSPDYLAGLMTDPSKSEVCEQFRKNPEQYIKDNYKCPPTYFQLSEDLGISETSVSYHIVKNKLQHLVKYTLSKMEDEVYQFLLELGLEPYEIIRHDRKVLHGKELDIYLPQYSFAIECNPSSSHNSDSTFLSEYPLSSVYHRDKSKLGADNGVFVFHLFGYNWVNKKEICKSMIRSRLNKLDERYYARNLIVREVPWKDCVQFLSENHLKGYLSSGIRLGLYNDSELLSVMTFDKMRNSQGYKSDDTEYTYELSRFCSKINTSVVGGASKLFKYFLSCYEYDKIISFSDIATTTGTLYTNLGFQKVNQSEPGYVWVDCKTESYFTRIQCKKSNLKHILKDDSIDIDIKSETQIMKEHGYVRVYDCGVIRWEYN